MSSLSGPNDAAEAGEIALSTRTLTTGATYPQSLSHFAVSVPAFLSALKDESATIDSSSRPALLPPPDTIAVGAFIFTTPSAKPPKILLLRRAATPEESFPLLWEVPGGGAEFPPVDETILDAVTREVFEETGLRVTRILGAVKGPNGEGWQEFEGRRIDPQRGRQRIYRKFNFFVEVEWLKSVDETGERKVQVKLADEEHVEYAWVARDELAEVEFTGEWMRRWVGAAFEQMMGEAST
ncbi:NUDIX hydrolase domain-like protein [Tirmania nivea]|nr:NUDIX hydrolase domain-like protein [Tirmania nivea]